MPYSLTSMTKPHQIIQDVMARLIFKQLKRTHVNPLLVSLQWLHVAACIKLKALTIHATPHA